MRIGGEATVRSYWNDPADLADASFDHVAERLPELVPEAHVRFLGEGEDFIEIGDYAFVHAGIRPGVPLQKQSPADLRWLRQDFLHDIGDHGLMIVHGPTIRARKSTRSELQSQMRLSNAVFWLKKKQHH